MMIPEYPINQMSAITGTVLPLAILLIENDEDRQFLTDLYLQNRQLMVKVASQFFRGNQAELEDAVSGAVERLCKKCDTLRQVECNKRPAYIVSTVRNVCLSRLREIARHRRTHEDFTDADAIENIPDQTDVQGMLFERVFAGDLLDAYPALNQRDRELIRLRHVDRMSYPEIAVQMGITENAARTAVSRARSRLERFATDGKWVNPDHE
jgi:RNA polymerase sigma-70 factor (ECF subfamily)